MNFSRGNGINGVIFENLVIAIVKQCIQKQEKENTSVSIYKTLKLSEKKAGDGFKTITGTSPI
jgi:hypothetical protein